MDYSRLVGVLMVVAVFGVILYPMIQDLGIKKASLLFGGAIFMVGWIAVAGELIFPT